MPTQKPRFNWGSEIKNINETLYNQLNDSYTSTARVLNTKPSCNVADTDPPSDDEVNRNFQQGDIWVNQSTDSA